VTMPTKIAMSERRKSPMGRFGSDLLVIAF
jgi:hypothetical protein